jgi:hypothetical protein
LYGVATVTEAEQLDAAIAAAIEALRELQRVRVSAMSAPAARKQPIATRRWELAARAFRRFPFEAHTVRRICANHPEWAVRLTEGHWHVDVDLFTEFADRVERGEASFAVSAMSAKSVANGPQLNENKHATAEEDDSDQNRETA